jgi:hypothetical protein
MASSGIEPKTFRLVFYCLIQLRYRMSQSCPCAQLIKHYAMKKYGGVDILIHIIFISALVGGDRSASRSGYFTTGERPPPSTHWIGGWVGPRAGLYDVEKRKFFTLPGLELRPLCRPARRQSLYRRLEYDATAD